MSYDICEFLRHGSVGRDHSMLEPPIESELERVTRQRDELLAALKELLCAAGPCDICYEDSCDQFFCECECHKQEHTAREEAAQTIISIEANK